MGKLKTYTKESEILNAVKKRLISYESVGIVEFHMRINSGAFQIGRRWVRTKVGFPDILCVIRNKNNGLSLLFFELKAEGKKIIKGSEQDKFFDKYRGIKDVGCFQINHPKEVDRIIMDIGVDRVKELPDEI